MSILDRLFGGSDEPERRHETSRRGPTTRAPAAELSDDERAVERYRYLLRTAPPETIEEAHAEAFAQLTPEQRRLLLQELGQALPERERAAAQGDDPQSLARVATRAEMRQPGTLERTFGGFSGGGMGMGGVGLGGLFAGSFLSSFAGMLVGGAIANQFFNDSGYDQGAAGGEAGDGADAGDQTDASGDAESGSATEDTGAGDLGDSGGFGGDFGGDFGGGDFGGGDFGGEF